MATMDSAAAVAASADPEGEPVRFETAMQELEGLVQQMEAGSLSLEDSVAAYRRGAQLVTWCRDHLTAIRQQVSVLEGDLLKPFEAEPREDA